MNAVLQSQTRGLSPVYLRLNPADDVVIACRELETGTNLLNEGVICRERIPPGHKVATRAIEAGQPVRRYSQIIGFATQPIAAGAHVHVHNLEVRDFARDYAYGEAYEPTAPARVPATFQGIVRPDGQCFSDGWFCFHATHIEHGYGSLM